MRALAALALALTACGSSAPGSEPALTGHHAPAATPTGPAPTIALGERGFETPGLPAIARAGDLVVLPIIAGDAGRGSPNLRVEVRDRRDKLAEAIEVMAADDYEELVPDGIHAGHVLERRIADANRRLAALHAEHDLTAMRAIPFTPEPFGPPKPVQGAGLAISFDADHQLRVRSDAGALLATVDGTGWLAPSGPRCAQCPPCENPAYLAGAYRVPGIDVLVVRIAYTGTDTCWEPGDQLHVIAW